MISKIILKNYRNLHLSGGLDLGALTVFIGPNGSGKTNIIRVLRFIQDALVGIADDRRGVSRFENAAAIFGLGRILDRAVEAPATVTIDARFELQESFTHAFTLELGVKDSNTLTVRRESMRRWGAGVSEDEGYKYYDANIAQGRIAVPRAFPDPVQKRRSMLHQVGELPANELALHSLQTWLEVNSADPSRNTPLFEGKRLIEGFAGEWAFYDASRMNIDAIRRASPELGTGDRTLSASGLNLLAVIFNVTQTNDEFEDRLELAMKELFPRTRKLRTAVAGRTSLSLEWYQQGVDRPFFLDEMSDGTVRMLCWASVLLSPKIPRLVVLDEPEANIHPAWLRVLAGWIREASRRSQVIVSTHSPDLLDYFTEDLPGIRVFESDRVNPMYVTANSVKVGDIRDKLDEGWKLGDLFRVGDPQIGGWPW